MLNTGTFRRKCKRICLGPQSSKVFLKQNAESVNAERQADKYDHIKIGNFCYSKDTMKRMRRKATNQEKMSATQ